MAFNLKHPAHDFFDRRASWYRSDGTPWLALSEDELESLERIAAVIKRDGSIRVERLS